MITFAGPLPSNANAKACTSTAAVTGRGKRYGVMHRSRSKSRDPRQVLYLHQLKRHLPAPTPVPRTHRQVPQVRLNAYRGLSMAIYVVGVVLLKVLHGTWYVFAKLVPYVHAPARFWLAPYTVGCITMTVYCKQLRWQRHGQAELLK